MIEGKAICKFGTGDILITPVIKDDFSEGAIVLQNKGTLNIGEYTKDFEPSEDDTILTFTKIESISVLIERLSKLIGMMQGNVNDTEIADYDF